MSLNQMTIKVIYMFSMLVKTSKCTLKHDKRFLKHNDYSHSKQLLLLRSKTYSAWQ